MGKIKGQAAVTDALYFLLIVTGITIFLFGFANSYGVTVDEDLVKNYNVDFTTDALKTILYSSVPRNPNESLYDSSETVEVDHLLAFVKEDFADNQLLEPLTQKVLGQNIKGILAPLASNFDYLFVLSVPLALPGTSRQFVFLFFHKSNLKHVELDGSGQATETSVSRKTAIGIPFGEEAFTDFFCGIGSDYSVLRAELDNLLSSVGETSQSSAKIKLVKIEGTGTVDVPAQAELIVWNSTLLFKNTPSGPVLFDSFFLNPDSAWKCISFEDLSASIQVNAN